MANGNEIPTPSEGTWLELSDICSENLLLTKLSPGILRLEESSLSGEFELYYHDVIEARVEPGLPLRFLRVVSKSGLVTKTFFLSKQLAESAAVNTLLARIMAVGGNWERAFGGLFILHFPPDEAASFQEEIGAIRQPAR
ncbi:MAG TPA: hypothetical protein VGN16_15945 [Acidobacteriaceae bacterium]|jgi:hypothetical protein